MKTPGKAGQVPYRVVPPEGDESSHHACGRKTWPAKYSKSEIAAMGWIDRAAVWDDRRIENRAANE
jgi:hypothetical protein